MSPQTVKAARKQAEEFIRRAKAYEKDREGQRYWSGDKLSGALRRQSMELTRSLATLRAYG